jgi:hypothetical protein
MTSVINAVNIALKLIDWNITVKHNMKILFKVIKEFILKINIEESKYMFMLYD